MLDEKYQAIFKDRDDNEPMSAMAESTQEKK